MDAAGQQLPYVDTVLSTIVDPETFNLKVVSGEADLAYLRTSFDNYTLYMENKEQAGYEVNLIPQFTSSEVTYYPNQSHPDPVKKALFTNANFRRALSVAIDRDEINEVLYAGVAVPQQWSVTSMASIYEEEWGTAYAQYDPDLANELLDGTYGQHAFSIESLVGGAAETMEALADDFGFRVERQPKFTEVWVLQTY